MDAIDLMKCADLAARLGKILGVNQVWEDEDVTYGLGDGLIDLWFDLDDGSWVIATDEGDYRMVRLPREATALMAEMSKTVEETEDE